MTQAEDYYNYQHLQGYQIQPNPANLPPVGGPQGGIPPSSLGLTGSQQMTGSAYATPIYDKNPTVTDNKALENQDQGLDEFDDLTVEELRSLLDNFKNLSKGEQMDLIRYMKKLEQTDPEKVKLLSSLQNQDKTHRLVLNRSPKMKEGGQVPSVPNL